MRRGAIDRTRGVGLAAVFVVLALSAPASGHETQTQGALSITVGWAEEPAYAGLRNSVEVEVTSDDGGPVDDADASLVVDVAFGTETATLQLVPAGPGLFRAPLVPTRPGTYTFRITGTISGQTLEIESTCGEEAFDCVAGLGEIQFPARDPSAGELAERIDRELSRTSGSGPSGGGLAVAALIISVLALTAWGLALRRSSALD